MRIGLLVAAAAGATRPHLLGVTCPTNGMESATGRELCDQYAFITELINNKSDGFLDDLMPTIELTTEEFAGCDDGSGAITASDALRTTHGQNLTAVLGSCSNEVVAVGDRARRETTGDRSVVISPYSNAASAANETEYVNVARLLATTDHTAEAAAAVCAHYGWSRIAILNDESSWAADSMRHFERRLRVRAIARLPLARG